MTRSDPTPPPTPPGSSAQLSSTPRWAVVDAVAGTRILIASGAVDAAAGAQLRPLVLTPPGGARPRIVLMLHRVRGVTPDGARALVDVARRAVVAGSDVRAVGPSAGGHTLDAVLAEPPFGRHPSLASALAGLGIRPAVAATIDPDPGHAGTSPAAPAFFSFREHDLDGARAAVGRDFFSLSIDLLDPTAHYEFRFDGVVFGALAVAASYVSAGMQLSMADLEDCYYVNYASSGSMLTGHRRGEVDVVPGAGALYHPTGPITMTSSDRYRSFAVRVDRVALTTALEERLGHVVRPDPVLGLRLDLAGDAGARWDRLVRLVCAEAQRSPSVLTHPMIAGPLHDAIVDGLLDVADHPWRAELERPARSWSRTATDRAVAVMRADPAHPFTPAELATIAGTNSRTLRDGFRRHLDASPMSYLRDLRLQRAHADLRAADPGTTTVSEVAARWGFTHLGRFAREYGQAYGRPPSATLGSPR